MPFRACHWDPNVVKGGGGGGGNLALVSPWFHRPCMIRLLRVLYQSGKGRWLSRASSEPSWKALSRGGMHLKWIVFFATAIFPRHSTAWEVTVHAWQQYCACCYSPLISLMKDHVRAMKGRKISAVYGGELDSDDTEQLQGIPNNSLNCILCSWP